MNTFYIDGFTACQNSHICEGHVHALDLPRFCHAWQPLNYILLFALERSVLDIWQGLWIIV